MENNKVLSIVGIAAVIIMLGFFMSSGKNSQEQSLHAKTASSDKIAGFDGQSTKIDTDENSLSAPSAMEVRGLKNISIEDDDEVGASKNEVSGLSGLSIE